MTLSRRTASRIDSAFDACARAPRPDWVHAPIPEALWPALSRLLTRLNNETRRAHKKPTLRYTLDRLPRNALGQWLAARASFASGTHMALNVDDGRGPYQLRVPVRPAVKR